MMNMFRSSRLLTILSRNRLNFNKRLMTNECKCSSPTTMSNTDVTISVGGVFCLSGLAFFSTIGVLTVLHNE